MTKEFYEDLAELAKKHKIAIMSGGVENLTKTTKGLQGNMFFVTNGEKVLSLQGGESAQFEASTTILLHKNRRKD
jgi:hypothetical protein